MVIANWGTVILEACLVELLKEIVAQFLVMCSLEDFLHEESFFFHLQVKIAGCFPPYPSKCKGFVFLNKCTLFSSVLHYLSTTAKWKGTPYGNLNTLAHFIHSCLHFGSINTNPGGIEVNTGKTVFMWKGFCVISDFLSYLC